MQNPATKAAIILILVSVSFMAAIATFPVFVHNTGTKSIGGLKPFCPDFTQWLENPEGWILEWRRSCSRSWPDSGPGLRGRDVPGGYPGDQETRHGNVGNPDIPVRSLFFP